MLWDAVGNSAPEEGASQGKRYQRANWDMVAVEEGAGQITQTQLIPAEWTHDLHFWGLEIKEASRKRWPWS